MIWVVQIKCALLEKVRPGLSHPGVDYLDAAIQACHDYQPVLLDAFFLVITQRAGVYWNRRDDGAFIEFDGFCRRMSSSQLVEVLK